MDKFLIIDDDPEICRVLKELADSMGHMSDDASTLAQGLKLATTGSYDLVMLDLQFPEGNGLDILPQLIDAASRPDVIIITGSGVQGAELAYKYDAWDYVQKPFLVEEIALSITRALKYRHEKKQAGAAAPLIRSDIIGNSPVMNKCMESVAKAAATDAGVLITGETGTGKELFAKAIHANSRRSARNFIVVDCAALPETLVESILFGHEKGAFTGADKRREGLIEQADGGTLFLDEIGDLPLGIQKSFLRALQEKRIRPLGAREEIAVDFRLIAATYRNLDRMVAEGAFREDLLFRIRAMEIKLPALRDRNGDIEEITIQKVPRLCQQYGMGIKGISPEFLETLKIQAWPGNVRELINVLEHALAYAVDDPTLIPKHIPYQYRAAALKGAAPVTDAKRMPALEIANQDHGFPRLSDYLDQKLKEYLTYLLDNAKGDRTKASALSGLSQSKLYALLKKHNLPRFRS
jgi:two-component system, NtrC family, response regulator